jgi:hypothetical protein
LFGSDPQALEILQTLTIFFYQMGKTNFFTERRDQNIDGKTQLLRHPSSRAYQGHSSIDCNDYQCVDSLQTVEKAKRARKNKTEQKTDIR